MAADHEHSAQAAAERCAPLPYSEMSHAARETVRSYLDANPYLVLGFAAGLGYVVAAGVPTPLLKYLIRAGVRSGVTNVVRTLFSGAVESTPLGASRMYAGVGRSNSHQRER